MTRLPNRRAFWREFPPFVTAPADGLARSVAIMDIDNFKRYNDLYGHAKGDEVLAEVGAILEAHVHQTGDLAFRIGGEEFLMATRTRKSEGAKMFFESVRKSIQAMNVEHDGNAPHGVVTVSIGYDPSIAPVSRVPCSSAWMRPCTKPRPKAETGLPKL